MYKCPICTFKSEQPRSTLHHTKNHNEIELNLFVSQMERIKLAAFIWDVKKLPESITLPEEYYGVFNV